MTSVFARNYNEKKLDRDYFLQATKEGLPLQKQVPQTYQRYTGLGQESIDLDGSSRLVLETDLASGPLVINMSDNYNLHGRVISVVLTRTLQSPLTFDFAPNGLIHTVGTDAVSNTLVLAAGQAPTTLILDFYSLTDMMLTGEGTAPGPGPGPIATTLNYVQALDASGVVDNFHTDPVVDTRVLFDPVHVDSTNQTTVTYDAVTRLFTVNTPASYLVMWSASYRGGLDHALRNVIGTGSGGTVVGRTWGVTSAGLINQNISLSWAGRLNAGDQIAVQSFCEPEGPEPGDYGLMNGQNTQDTTARNFIKVIQF